MPGGAGIRNELRRVGNINFMQLLYALMIGGAHTHTHARTVYAVSERAPLPLCIAATILAADNPVIGWNYAESCVTVTSRRQRSSLYTCCLPCNNSMQQLFVRVSTQKNDCMRAL